MAYTRAMFRAKSMKVDVSTELNCSAVKAWNEVQKSSLLLQVIWPLARIVSVDGRSFPERWTEGLTIQCRSYLFGFIPTGVRNLHFQRIDQINFEIRLLRTTLWSKAGRTRFRSSPWVKIDRSIVMLLISTPAV